MALMACTGDEELVMPQDNEIELSATMSATPYNEAETRGITRAWTAPVGYVPYDNLYEGSFENIKSLAESPIDIFLTHDAKEGFTTPTPLHARLRYSPAPPPSDSKWKLVLPNTVKEEDMMAGTYYAYGFIPRDAAADAAIEKLSPESPDSYSDGVKLTINGMKTVAHDACVIIGANDGPDADNDGGLRAGDFSFDLKIGGGKNYLYFLFDHLCSALIINMKVNGEYNALRHIKLKKIFLETATAEGPMKEKAKVTVTLAANGTGANPIQSVTYTPTGDAVNGDYVFTSKDGVQLPAVPAEKKFLTHFIPKDVTQLILTSTYDVYDTKNNLIREGCKATNTIPLSLIDRFDEAKRGNKYILNMTINPTYLYVLSEPDLDNPTVVVE